LSRRTDIAQTYIDASLKRDPASIDALAAALADDAVLVTRRDTVTGKPAILQRLRGPAAGAGFRSGAGRLAVRFLRWRLARSRPGSGQGLGNVLGKLNFDPPVEHGATVKLRAPLPPNPAFSAVSLTFTFDAEDRLKRIEQALT
jgi:hypothetical protein